MCTGEISTSLSEQTKFLSQAVLRRARLRTGAAVDPGLAEPLGQALLDLFIARAWDLAAHFVQARSGALHGVDAAVSRVLESITLPQSIATQLKDSVIELLTRPDSREAEVLAELGRLSFAVQLALGDSRTTFSYSLSVPQRIYWDASVLMAAIVAGHPLQSVFQPVLERLRSATRESGGQVAIIAPLEFLNEVVTHRQNAIRELESRKLDNPDNLAREAIVFGMENLNVFVGAYATEVGRPKKKIQFQEFLRRVAPYDDEKQLREF